MLAVGGAIGGGLFATGPRLAAERVSGWLRQLRATPLAPDDVLYRDVDYFLSYMSNGLPISGPGARP